MKTVFKIPHWPLTLSVIVALAVAGGWAWGIYQSSGRPNISEDEVIESTDRKPLNVSELKELNMLMQNLPDPPEPMSKRCFELLQRAVVNNQYAL